VSTAIGPSADYALTAARDAGFASSIGRAADDAAGSFESHLAGAASRDASARAIASESAAEARSDDALRRIDQRDERDERRTGAGDDEREGGLDRGADGPARRSSERETHRSDGRRAARERDESNEPGARERSSGHHPDGERLEKAIAAMLAVQTPVVARGAPALPTLATLPALGGLGRGGAVGAGLGAGAMADALDPAALHALTNPSTAVGAPGADAALDGVGRVGGASPLDARSMIGAGLGKDAEANASANAAGEDDELTLRARADADAKASQADHPSAANDTLRGRDAKKNAAVAREDAINSPNGADAAKLADPNATAAKLETASKTELAAVAGGASSGAASPSAAIDAAAIASSDALRHAGSVGAARIGDGAAAVAKAVDATPDAALDPTRAIRQAAAVAAVDQMTLRRGTEASVDIEGLGRVKVAATGKDAMHIEVRSARAETAALIANHVPALRDELRAEAIAVGRLDVRAGLGDGGGKSGERAPGDGAHERTASNDRGNSSGSTIASPAPSSVSRRARIVL
jgi:hypothetical protein